MMPLIRSRQHEADGHTLRIKAMVPSGKRWQRRVELMGLSGRRDGI